LRDRRRGHQEGRRNGAESGRLFHHGESFVKEAGPYRKRRCGINPGSAESDARRLGTSRVGITERPEYRRCIWEQSKKRPRNEPTYTGCNSKGFAPDQRPNSRSSIPHPFRTSDQIVDDVFEEFQAVAGSCFESGWLAASVSSVVWLAGLALGRFGRLRRSRG